MADNVTITSGIGTTIATDQVVDGTLGTVHVQYVKLMDGTLDGTSKAAVGANGLKVDGSGATQPVSAVSLPLPTGASTAAKQPALGTAGAASTDVITVQGIASMTALKVDGSAVTQPVSAASLPLPTGAATAAKQPSLGIAGTPSADVISVQGVTSMTALKVDGSAVVQPASQSGTWTVQPGNTANTTAWLVTQVPATSGGLTIYRLLSAATTNGNNIKGSAGQVYGWAITNTNASARFVKLYNKATSPTVGTDTPVMTLTIPGNTAGAGMVFHTPSGIAFGTGIGIAVTGAVTDADTTAVAANEVVVNLFYK